MSAVLQACRRLQAFLHPSRHGEQGPDEALACNQQQLLLSAEMLSHSTLLDCLAAMCLLMSGMLNSTDACAAGGPDDCHHRLCGAHHREYAVCAAQ